MVDVLDSVLGLGLSTAGTIGVALGAAFLFAILLAKAYRRVVEPNETHNCGGKR